jgi:predicted alpha/beta hydrolase family esterase
MDSSRVTQDWDEWSAHVNTKVNLKYRWKVGAIVHSNGCSAALRWLVEVIQGAAVEHDYFQIAVLINPNMEIKENRY